MMNINDELLSIAMKSDVKAKYAAVIIYRNKVIGIGYNYIGSYTTHYNQCLL
jgi:deoxycytidylate deaminase